MWADVDTDSIDDRLIEEEIYSILNEMHPRYAKIVMLRNGYQCTYREIGEVFKVTAARVREIDLKAQRILRSRYEGRFRKLRIPWIDQHYLEIEREKEKARKESERWRAEYHEKCVQEKIAEVKLKKAREKLKIVDSEIPKPEAIVKPYSPKPPYFPPHIVKLVYSKDGSPYLHVDPNYGSINRDLDPKTYDRWLAYLIDPKSTKVWND